MEEYFDIVEKIDPSVRYALIEQFDTAVLALLEITDNSIAEKLPNKPIEIRITIKRNSISYTDKGGRAMNRERLGKFLTWGLGDRKSVFRFHGQGGKAALAYLANNFTLHSTPEGEDVTYWTEVKDWPKDLGQVRTIRFNTEKAMFDFPSVSYRLTDITKPLAPAEVKRRLAETYRPLIVKDMLRIWVNSSKIVPVEIPYIEKSTFSETTPFGPVEGWVGLKPEGSPVRGGVRCYALGRLISKKEFFGLDQSSFDIEHIVGEVELPFIPVITLKTDFNKGSKEWSAACEVVKPKLQPFARRVFYISKELDGLDKLLPMLKKEIAEILRLADETVGLGGRKPPVEGKEGKRAGPREHQMSFTKPATPRPPNAVGHTPRQGPWVFATMDENIRSGYDKEKGILINRTFPACVTAWQLYKYDRRPLLGHIVETMALEWFTRDKMLPREIKERVNHLLKIAYER